MPTRRTCRTGSLPALSSRASWLRLTVAAGVVAWLATASGAQTPPAEPLKVSPQTLTVGLAQTLPDVQAAQAESAWALFDRDTTTAHLPWPGGTSWVDLDFGREVALEALAVYGSASSWLTAYERTTGRWVMIPGLNNVSLDNLPVGWTRLPANSRVTVRELRLEFRPRPVKGAPQGLRELAVWAGGAIVPVAGGRHLRALADAGVLPPHAREVKGTPAEVETGSGAARVTVALPYDPRLVKRAYLAYDTVPVAAWVSAARRVNGLTLTGGYPTLTATGWAAQVEAVPPLALTKGDTTIEFTAGAAGGYRVRNLRLLIELDSGSNAVALAAVRTAAGPWGPADPLFDGDLATGVAPAGQTLEWRLDEPTQADALRLFLQGSLKGEALFSALQGATWVPFPVGYTLQLDTLAEGWNVVPLPKLGAIQGLRLALPTPGRRDPTGQLMEVRLTGQVVGSPAERRAVRVASPEEGEFYGRRAYLVGWLEPARVGAGTPTLFVDGRKVEGYPGAADGAFSLAVSKDAGRYASDPDDAPWATTLKAVYPDGVEVSATVPLTVNRLGKGATPDDAATAGGGAAGGRAGGVPTVSTTRLPGPRAPHACARELVYPEAAKTLRCKRVVLEIPAGAVAQPTEIVIEALAEEDLTRLDTGLLNVTGDDAGYRFLPHGLQFQKPVRVGVPYDKKLLPAGTPEETTLTHYNQGPEARWHPLKKLSHDARNGLVVSETTHFTDLINATLVLPEHPQPLAYNPTSIKDIKAADPGAGITLIEPPQASPFGTAQTSFPLRLPPGRGAYQPDVRITYKGTTENGWVGVGWELSISSLQIDTRFGVPRYTGQEIYLLDGAQLAPVGDDRYQTRVEGQFRRIVRHGDSPQSYSWEVTDKTGTRFLYGATPQARLASYATGAIFQWFLETVTDANGNVAQFSYDHDQADPGAAGEPWTQAYLKDITYTAHTSGVPGRYHVRFVRDDGSRPDRLIAGRAGFKVLTRFRLDHVDVLFDDALIRRYQLTYTVGDFSKSLLTAIAELGEGATQEFTRHEFDYFTMPTTDDAIAGFSDVTVWPEAGHADALTRSDEVSGQVSVFLGLGPPGVIPPQPHVGVIGGFSHGEEDTRLQLVDLDGDGLPDLTRQNGSVRFTHLGDNRFTGAFTPGSFPGLTVLNETARNSFTAGVALHDSTDSAGLTGQYIYSLTDSRSLLADVNGDGFVDQIHRGQVRFNTGQGFSPAAPLGGYTTAGLDFGLDGVQAQLKGDLPLTDPLRRWKAPFAGTIRLTGAITKVQAGGDGLRASLVLNTNQVWTRTFGPQDTTPCEPTSGNACAAPGAGGLVLTVAAGDDLYVTVNALDDTDFDLVSWDPVILYLDACRPDPLTGAERCGPLTDAELAHREPNGALLYRYQASSDFALAGAEADLRARFNGTVHIAATLTKQVTSDDVRVRVLRQGVPVYEQVFAWDQTVTLPQEVTVAVEADDALSFRLDSDSQIDPARVQWTPVVTYTTVCVTDPASQQETCETLTPEQQQTQAPDGSFLYRYEAQLTSPVHSRLPAGPRTPWVAPKAGEIRIRGAVTKAATDAPVIVSIKRLNQVVRKLVLAPAQAGSFFTDDVLLPVVPGQQLTFGVDAASPADAAQVSWAPTIVYPADCPTPGEETCDPTFTPPIHVTVPDPAAATDAFAGGHHRWWYGEWNGNEAFDEMRIRRPASDQDQEALRLFRPMLPKHEGETFAAGPIWRGLGHQSFIGPERMNPSRRGANVAGVFAASLSGIVQKAFAQNFMLGGNVGGGTASLNTGESFSKLDLLDVNGDRYPDQVSAGTVRFNTGQGTFGAAEPIDIGFGHLRRFKNDNASFGFGLGVVTNRIKATGVTKEILNMVAGLNIGASYGISQTTVDVVDVNGDGLPDHVQRAPGDGCLHVRLNLGYHFGAEECWPAGAWAVGDISLKKELTGDPNVLRHGDNLTVSLGGGKFGIGHSASHAEARTTVELADLNGDGLPDQLMKRPSEPFFRVRLNLGDRFSAVEQHWSVPSWPAAVGAPLIRNVFGESDTVSFTGTLSFSANAQASIWIPIIVPPGVWVLTVGAEISGGGAVSTGGLELQFTDLNGDGLPDHVLKFSGDDRVLARLNQVGKTNLLKTIRRPLGATIALDYRREGNTVAMPQSQWVLARVAVHDGVEGDGVSEYVTTYAYADGFQDRAEREFYGFRTVVETRPDGSRVAQTFHNRDFFQKGLLVKAVTKDKDERLFLKTEHTYEVRDVAEQVKFPARVRTATFFYEGLTTDEGQIGNATADEFDYDTFGNVARVIDRADVGPDDDVFVRITYLDRLNPYLVGRPTSIVVTDTAGRLFRERKGQYDARGNLIRLERTVVGSVNPVYQLTYDTFGNLTSIVDPKGYALSYAYDPEVQTHVARIRDSFGYVSTAEHNLKFGLLTKSVDVAGNPTAYTYDAFGRLVVVNGPHDVGSPVPTIRMTYDHTAQPAQAVTFQKEDHTVTTTLDTVLAIDGLTRVIQTKKEADVEHASGSIYGMTITGKILFDERGRVAAQGQAVFEPGYSLTYSPNVLLKNPTRFAHDILGRTLKTIAPDGATTRVQFDFEAGLFRTTATDAEGQVRYTLRALPDRIVAVDEVLGGQRHRTHYAYSILDELTEVIDAKGNRTTITYDTLGRRTAIDNPDTGKVEFRYDAGDNLIAKITANLRAAGQQITYLYDFNRLREIRFPETTPVTYVYGPPAAPFNQAGRIVSVTDESGSEERFYGKLGETVKTIKTVASETGSKPEVYTTEQAFDSFGRMRTLAYPDGEVLTYTYDNGGLLKTAIGEKRGNRYTYVKHLGYDEFGQRAGLVYGNLVETRYTYDPLTRRLASLMTKTSSGAVLQALTYRYDLVGNVLGASNTTPVQRFGSVTLGPVEQTYTYDGLYRLTQAVGRFEFDPEKVNQYTSVFTYDAIHNLRQKLQMHTVGQPSGPEIEQRETTYSLNFQYGGPKPHAATADGERTYQYDPSGNLVRWDEVKSGRHREVRWTEENRIRAVVDTGRTTTFRYNADGERVFKRGQFGETAFVNQFYTVRNAEVATKHVFAGETRVASQLVHQGPAQRQPLARNANGSQEAGTTTRGVATAVQLDDTALTLVAATPSRLEASAASLVAMTALSARSPVLTAQTTPTSPDPTKAIGLERAAQGDQTEKQGVLKQAERVEATPGAAQLAESGRGPSGPPPGQAKPHRVETPGQAKKESLDTLGQGNRPAWAGPHETRGLERALEVGRGQKLGIHQRVEDGETPPTQPGLGRRRSKTSPAIDGAYLPQEFQLFFYHGDHLGSSSVITDAYANVFEHVEYFPFGEPWVDQGGTATLTPYRFTGKELDPETGLYYYGTRYYEPRLQRWLSSDPSFEAYLDRQGPNSIFNPHTLASYNYTWLNPVKLTDPDGREPNRSQAVTWPQARAIILAHAKQQTPSLQNLRYTEGATGGGNQVGPFGGNKGGRYVWTTKRGWIDLGHFFQVAAEAERSIGTGIGKDIARTIGRSYANSKLWERTREVENRQQGETRWSYEDPASNQAGLDFFLDYYKDGSALTDTLDKFFKDAGAAAPSRAPNWRQMQLTPQKERRFEPATSMDPVLNPRPIAKDSPERKGDER